MSKPIVIYHANCIDGFTAAWCFWYHFGDAFEYHPGVYNEAPPDVTDREVYLVDFSYSLDVMQEKIIPFAKSVVMLDHHKSALESLAPLRSKIDMRFCTNDNSGAYIAWDYLQFKLGKEQPPPKVLLHIQDRDLWRFYLPETKAIAEYVFAQEYDFDAWSKMMLATEKEIETFRIIGETLYKRKRKEALELIEVARYYAIIDGVTVPVVNSPYFYASEIGEELSKHMPFAATYYDTGAHRVFSLRSNASYWNAVDVSKIAAKFNGGGHFHAAGFKVSRTHVLGCL